MLKNWPLKILLLLFLIPFFAAILVLKFGDRSKFETVAHGTLLNPPQAINLPSVASNIWQIVYINPTPCDESCKAQQKTLQNLHIALGANQSRVKVINIEPNDQQTTFKSGSILIVDPHNLALMQYAPEDDMRGLLKDIKRLLKYSHV